MKKKVDAKTLQRWRELIALSGKSMGELGKAIGKDRSYVPAMLTGKEPGVFTALRLAGELGVSLEEFLNGTGNDLSVAAPSGYRREAHQQAARILTDVLAIAQSNLEQSQLHSGNSDLVVLLTRWWHSTGGVLGGHENFAESVDLIHVPAPDATTVVPAKVGTRSLAARDLETSDPNALAQLVRTFDSGSRRRLVKSYLEVATEKRPVLSPLQTAKIVTPSGQIFTREWFRFQIPVTSPDGTPFVMSYCFRA